MTLLGRVPVPMLLGISAASVVAGDTLAKFWSTNHRPALFWLSLLAYAASGIFYVPTLVRAGLIVTSTLWGVADMIGFLFIGFVIFHETLSPLQLVGVGFGAVAVIILAIASA